MWKGTRAPADKKPACTVRGKAAIAEAIEESGRAIVYGIYFATDSDRLEASSDAVLHEVLSLVQAKPEICLTLEGHTDSTADDAHNLELSKRRAQAVVNWLVEHGAQQSALRAAGFGETRPVAGNDTVQGRALNRRVEVVRTACGR